jgi:hypothetical protein
VNSQTYRIPLEQIQEIDIIDTYEYILSREDVYLDFCWVPMLSKRVAIQALA